MKVLWHYATNTEVQTMLDKGLMRKVASIKVRRYRCNTCGLIAKDAGAVGRHIKQVHS